MNYDKNTLVFNTILGKIPEKTKLIIIKDYLLNGADINAKDANGHTFLTLAASKGHTKIVEFLLLSGASPNAKGPNENTALHFAIMNNHKELVNLLLSVGTNPNTQNLYGETALHYAVKFNRSKIMELLLNANIDTDIKNIEGFTAVEYAEMANKSITFHLQKLLQKVETKRKLEFERNVGLLFLGWTDKGSDLSKLPAELIMMIATETVQPHGSLKQPKTRFDLTDHFFTAFQKRKIETRPDHPTPTDKHPLQNPTDDQPRKKSKKH